jgi:hypothetical protein
MEEESQAKSRHAKFPLRYGCCHADSPRNLLHIVMAATVQVSVDWLSVDERDLRGASLRGSHILV